MGIRELLCYNPSMFRRKPFPFSLLILFIVVTLHLVGSYYSLYWAYSWFEVLVHVFSGLWIASTILWLASVFGQLNSLKEYKIKSFLIAFVSAALVGVVWELLENFTQITFTRASGYYLNTALDLFNDCLGGVLAYTYFIQKRKCADNSSQDILHPFYNQTGLIKN